MTIYSFFSNFTFAKDDDNGLPEYCTRNDAGYCCCCNHNHFLCNNNFYCRTIGLFGFRIFDKHRKFLFGLSSFSCVACIILCVYSCCANSFDGNVIQSTYWLGLKGYNESCRCDYTIYVGLQAVHLTSCDRTLNSCEKKTLRWSSLDCNPFPFGSICGNCRKYSAAMFWVSIGALGCLFQSFQDSQIRMRIVADSPAIKFFSVLNEITNIIQILFALHLFVVHCHVQYPLPSLLPESKDKLFVSGWAGPGYISLVLAITFACMRIILYTCTPIPIDKWKMKHTGRQDHQATIYIDKDASSNAFVQLETEDNFESKFENNITNNNNNTDIQNILYELVSENHVD